MINVLYVDKKNIEFIGFLCGTCGTFGKRWQHKTISLVSPIIHSSPHPHMYVFLLSYVRCAKNIRTSPKKLTYDNAVALVFVVAIYELYLSMVKRFSLVRKSYGVFYFFLRESINVGVYI